MFASGTIIKSGNTNYSLVGITPSIAKTVGASGNLNNVPSVDSFIAACSGKLAQDRTNCWASLDKRLMTQGRSLGPVPLAEQRLHHRPERLALELRPVHGRSRLLVGGRQAVRKQEPRGRARVPPPPPSTTKNTMAFYIVRRLVWTLVVVACVLAITFAVFFLLPAGDPALRFAGKNPTDAELAQIHHRLGLDKPFYVQFGNFTWHFFTGDKYGWPGLGYTYASGSSVKSLIEARAPRTLLLIAGAAIIWLVLGVGDRRALRGQAPIRDRPIMPWASRSSGSRLRCSGSA